MTDATGSAGGWPHGPAGFGPAAQQGMTVGQLLDRIFRLVRAHLRLFVTLAMAPAAAAACAFLLLGGLTVVAILPEVRLHASKPDLGFLAWLVPVGFLLYCAVFVVYALYGAAALYAVVKTDRGETVTGAEAWSAARSKAGRYILLVFFLALILIVPIYFVLGLFAGTFALSVLPAVQHHTPPSPALFTAMPLFMVLNLGMQVYVVLMFLRYGLSIPACVMEDLPAVRSLKRSAALTRGGKGRIFLVLLVMYAASFIVVLVCEVALFLVVGMGVFAGALMHVTAASPALWFFFMPLGLMLCLVVLLAVLALPYVGYSTALGVCYGDQKRRIDGAAAPGAAGGSA
jgi:hypothetical protein